VKDTCKGSISYIESLIPEHVHTFTILLAGV